MSNSARKAFALRFRRCAAGPSGSTASSIDRGRLSIPADGFLAEQPTRLLELFALAARERLEMHPTAMRTATRDAKLIDAGVREDPARQRAVHGSADQHRHARRRPALDERSRRIRPLRSRLRPGRRADAVRHVSPLYGRRAFDPRHRPARRDRARRPSRRPSAGDRAVPPDRVAAHALCRCAAARHRQGPRRRSQRHRRGDRAEAVPALRARPRRDRDGRLAGPAPSADVVDRLQARPRRPQDDRGFRPRRCKAPSGFGCC